MSTSWSRAIPTTSELLTWRIVRDGPRPGATNMALDHALAAESAAGEAVLRIYGWARPTVSFGRNEPAREAYGSAADRPRTTGSTPRSERVDWVRRPTGGRAVLHDAEVTYAVVARADALGGPRLAYRRINEALAGALASLGAPVALSGPAATPTLDAGPCFQSPAEGEVTMNGRKLVGSAQARVEGALLQHGSILLAGDQTLLEDLRGDVGASTREAAAPMVVGPGAGASPRSATKGRPGAYAAPATLSLMGSDVSFDDVSDAVARHMQKTFDGAWRTDDYRQSELDTATRLEAERYGTEAWTWRR